MSVINHNFLNKTIDNPQDYGKIYLVLLNTQIDSGGVPEWPKGADCKSVAIASKVRILLPPLTKCLPMWRNWQTHRT